MAATDVLQAVDSATFRDAESHLNADGEVRSFEILELMCDSYDDTHTMIGDLGNSGGKFAAAEIKRPSSSFLHSSASLSLTRPLPPTRPD